MLSTSDKLRIIALATGALAIIGIGASIQIQEQIDEAGQHAPQTLTVVPKDDLDDDGSDSDGYDYDQVAIDRQSFIAATTSPTQIDPAHVGSIVVPASIESLIPPQFVSAPIITPTVKPGITAKAYIVGDVLSKKVYLSSNSNVVMPVASMSKLITTIAATDTMTPTTLITITPAETDVAPDGSGIGAGETYTLKDILYPLLLDSSNIAAEAIASSSDRTKFLELMSSYAWEVGMPTAFFADPSGLSQFNHASAVDMFALAQYLYTYRPDILAVTRIPHMAVATTTDHGAHSFDSIHPYIGDIRFVGGKTGRTAAAGETMMTILNIGGRPIAFIILGSDYGRRQADTDLLIKKFQDLKE